MERLDRIEQALKRLKSSGDGEDVIDLTDETAPPIPAPLTPATVPTAQLDDWATDVVSTVVKTIWTSPNDSDRMKQRAQRARGLLGEEAGELTSATDRPVPESSGPPPEDARAPQQ